MIRRDRQLGLCLCLLLVNLAFIWGNSMLPAEASSSVSDFVQELLNLLPGPEAAEEEGPHLLRKIAHFTEFLLLGLNLGWLFALLGQTGIHQAAMALLAGSLSACLDETIQLFPPGRSSSLVDVWIDIAGVTAGITLLLLWQAMANHPQPRKPHHFGG